MRLPSLITSLHLSDDCRSDKEKRYPLSPLLLFPLGASLSKHVLGHPLLLMMLRHR